MTKSLLSAAVLSIAPGPRYVTPLQLSAPAAALQSASLASAPKLQASPLAAAAPVAAAAESAKPEPGTLGALTLAAPAFAKSETAAPALAEIFGERSMSAAGEHFFFSGIGGGSSREERAKAATASHEEAKNRFVLTFDGVEAEMTYQTAPDGTIVIDHTGVPEQIGSLGLGKKLAEKAVEFAKAKGIKIVPACPFMRDYMLKRPETHELVHPQVKRQMGFPLSAEQQAAREALRPKAEAAQVSHETAHNAFVIKIDGQPVAVLQYGLTQDGVVVIVRAQTTEEYSGFKLTAKLIQAAVAWARAEGKLLAAQDKYTVQWLVQHPETHDVLHPKFKQAFGL